MSDGDAHQRRVTETFERSAAPWLFADEEAWWRSQWSGARHADTEVLDDETRARYRVAAFEHLQGLRGPDGIRSPRPVLITTAVRPSLDHD